MLLGGGGGGYLLLAGSSFGYAAKLSDGFRIMPELGIFYPVVGAVGVGGVGGAGSGGGIFYNVSIGFLVGGGG